MHMHLTTCRCFVNTEIESFCKNVLIGCSVERMAIYKKVGSRCEGAACDKFQEWEVKAIPAEKEFAVMLDAAGFVEVEIGADGMKEKRMLCAACREKLNGIFK